MRPVIIALSMSGLVMALVLWSNTFPYTPGTGDLNLGGTISFFAGALAGGFLVACAMMPFSDSTP